MKNFRNLLSGLVITAACVSTQAGCNAPSDGRIELRYMAWGNPQQLALEEQLCDDYTKSQSKVRVKLFKVPQSAYGNKMLIMLASRTAPDVMRVDHYNFPALVKKDYFYPLDKLAAADPEFKPEEFFPSTLEESKHNGKLYALNVLFGGVILYYNKTMVQQAGLEDPFQLWKKGEWTWDRFLDHAKKMTQRGANGKFTRFGASIPVFPTYLGTIRSLGGEIMDPTCTQVLLGKGKSVEAWRFWYNLRYKHKAAPTTGQAANGAFSFESGKLGMYFDWMGMAPRFRESAKGFDWDVVPIPQLPGSVETIVKGNQLVICAETAHPQEAWKFMTYMTSVKVENLLAVDRRRTFPTRKSVAYSDAYNQTTLPPYNTRAFTYSIEVGKPLPITSRWGDWSGEFNSGIENLLNGRATSVEAAVAEAQSRAEKALETREGL